MTLQLVETVTLASSASSIEFTSIPQDGVDLVIFGSLRNAIDGSDFKIVLNNTNLGFSTVYLRATDSQSVSAGSQTDNEFRAINRSGSTANTFSSTQLYISNYTSVTNKSISYESVGENNGTAPMAISASSFSTSVGITTVKLDSLNLLNFVAGSTASLYKIS